jgi:hypothetical protein
MRPVPTSTGALVLALAAAGLCACGGEGGGGATPPPDGGPPWPQLDATGRADAAGQDAQDVAPTPQQDAAPCSLPAWDPSIAPTHAGLVAYDNAVSSDPLTVPQYTFVDAQGIAGFGYSARLRISLDGELVGQVPNPPGQAGEPMNPVSIAQTPWGYGVVLHDYSPTTLDYYFCVLTDEGWPDVKSSCDHLVHLSLDVGPQVAWDGAGFHVFGRTSETMMYIRRYDADGAFIDEHPFPTAVDEGLRPVVLPGSIVLSREGGRNENKCQTTRLNVLPRSLDVSAMQTWDLLPLDFKEDLPSLVTSSGTRAVVWDYGVCYQQRPGWSSDDVCVQNWPPDPPCAMFMSIIDSDGTPIMIRERISTYGYQLAWDGQHFVNMGFEPQSAVGSALVLSFDGFTPDGMFTMRRAKPTLMYSYSPHRLDGCSFAAVGPDDYVLTYSLSDTGEVYVARFTTVPM